MHEKEQLKLKLEHKTTNYLFVFISHHLLTY